MRFDEIDNIWTSEVDRLSRADRGRLFFERAKQVVARIIADPKAHPEAVSRGKISRTYLTTKIGAGPAVATQNPKIRQLLENADKDVVRRSTGPATSSRPTPGMGSRQVDELQAIIDGLRRTNEVQAAEITELKRKLRESVWLQTELDQHGRLPW